ncbi:MAG: phenylacetate--CoA ligase family protein [Anaerolineales bacterium]
MTWTKKIESIYPELPIALQNVLISGQGLAFRHQRFGAGFSSALEAAIQRSQWCADQLEDWQISTTRNFLNHARMTSPYWGERFLEAGFDPASLQVVSDIRRVPILEKADLRGRTDQIASSMYARKQLIASHTSGTTGSPIHVGFTLLDTRTRMAILYRMFKLFQIAPLQRSIRLSGRTLFPDAARNRVFWRMNYAANQMLMSSYDLHPDNLKIYVDRMASYRPDLVDGYPSSIFVLARFINAQGWSGLISPKAVMTTAETLEEYQRSEIERAFGGCPVINQYASSEGAPFITQDTNGEMVVNTDTGIFEFVRPGTDVPAGPGEIAEMLVTSFTTHAYPLIRYRIGDTVLLPQESKRSRVWDMPVVEKVLGRQEDILYTPDRGYVGRLDPVFKKAPSTIVECQIVHVEPRKVLLKVVPDRAADYHISQLDIVKEEIRLRLGDVVVSVEECDALPRGVNGKLRAVVGLRDADQD